MTPSSKYIASLAGAWFAGLAPLATEFYIEARQNIYREEGLDKTTGPTVFDFHRAVAMNLTGLAGFMLFRPDGRRQNSKPNGKYHAGDRVSVETFGGALPEGRYDGTVRSFSILPESEQRGPFYTVDLDEGAGVSCFEGTMTPLKDTNPRKS